MSGIELEDYASRREMSNQHLVKARFSPTHFGPTSLQQNWSAAYRIALHFGHSHQLAGSKILILSQSWVEMM